METKRITGRKVFFLYPHSVMQEEMIEALLRQEYEVYLAKDHDKIKNILAEYPDSIVFINIDTVLKGNEWETYIRELMKELPDLRIGIMSYNSDEEIARKYLMEIGVQCGFIRLKLGLKESTAIILKALQANEAKGRRKYVRAQCQGNIQASFNMRTSDGFEGGEILDISIAGMACQFSNAGRIPVKVDDEIDDIQLKLKGSLAKVSGKVVGIREEGNPVYVILFDKSMKQPIKSKIRNFVFHALHKNLGLT
ncbi:MAG: PilZ domain-containing protein [Spirochaetia bacterium]